MGIECIKRAIQVSAILVEEAQALLHTRLDSVHRSTATVLHLCLNTYGGENSLRVIKETMERDEEILPAIGYLVAGITAMLTRISKETLAPFNITPVETAILMYCSRNLTNTTQRLVDAIHLDQASISRHTAKLVAKGLIRRTRPFDDRRVVRLEMTEEGWALMPRLIESHQNLNSLVNLGIDREDKSIFLDILRKVHKNLQAGLPEVGQATAGRYGGEPKSGG